MGIMYKKLLFGAIFGIMLPVFVLAQNTQNLEALCQELSSSDTSCNNMTASECRSLLEKCATYYDGQSAEIAKDITRTEQQKKTLNTEISTLRKKITDLGYKINQGNIMVKDLNLQIDDTQESVDRTSLRIEDSQKQIATILRSIYEQDQKPAFVVLLEGSLSDYFSDISNLANLHTRVSDLLKSTTDLKTYLENQRGKMDQERVQLQKTIQVQSLQKSENEQNKKSQEGYLKLTESQYQQQLRDKKDAEKRATAIKSRIFDLIGVTAAPTFEEAVKIAKNVASITGVRAALILAILTQESNVGKNVGQCYLKNTSTGDGVKIKTGAFSPKTMSPSRDIKPFFNVTESLNKDPFTTPVSCVIYYNGRPYGWGGAMGPAQFIPSTWVNLGYGQKVTAITGRPANPWDIRDAFMASGMLLRDNGAKTNEFNAAMKYYCGGSCTNYDRFYANSVISIASQYEADIKAIGG